MGIIDVSIKNYKDVVQEIEDMQKKGTKAVGRTVSDFKTRAPSWVSQEVAAEYNIKKADVKKHMAGTRKAGKIKVKGIEIDNVQMVYEGRTLTPTHFGMKPKERPERGPYVVTAQIKKTSGRKALGSRVFLAEAGSAGTTQIPFQRTTKDRYPIKSVKTLSVPQMITNEDAAMNINKRINEEMEKRLKYNLNRLMK